MIPTAFIVFGIAVVAYLIWDKKKSSSCDNMKHYEFYDSTNGKRYKFNAKQTFQFDETLSTLDYELQEYETDNSHVVVIVRQISSGRTAVIMGDKMSERTERLTSTLENMGMSNETQDKIINAYINASTSIIEL